MSRPPSRADRDLELRLRGLGIELEAKRIQRFREVGLLVAPEPRYPGGGGSTGRYPPEVVERVREAIELAAKHPKELYVAVLEMFGRGTYRVHEGKVKRHLLHLMDRFEHELRAAASASDAMNPSDVAVEGSEVLAKRLARDPRTQQLRSRIPRRSKDNSESRLAGLTDFVADLASIFLTGTPLTHDTSDLIGVLGVPGVADRTAGNEPLADLFDANDWSAPARIGHIRSVIASASLEGLEVARDEFKDLLRAAAAARALYRPAEPPTPGQVGRLRARSDLDYAYGAVAIEVLRSRWPEEVEQLISLARTTM